MNPLKSVYVEDVRQYVRQMMVTKIDPVISLLCAAGLRPHVAARFSSIAMISDRDESAKRTLDCPKDLVDHVRIRILALMAGVRDPGARVVIGNGNATAYGSDGEPIHSDALPSAEAIYAYVMSDSASVDAGDSLERIGEACREILG